MKKNLLNLIPLFKSGIKKTLLIMKLTLIIVFLSVLQVSANVYSQITVNLDIRDKSIREVLKTIEEQSQIRFFYSDDLLIIDEPIDIKADKIDIISVLDGIFSNSPLTYKAYDNNLIVIIPRKLVDQQIITGTVTDENGNLLPGVTVLLKGTTIGSLTDASGKYTIDDVPENAILIFSFVGMITQEIPLNGRNMIDVVLKGTIIGLDEVVVIGYGTQKKVNMTGSVESIKGDQILKQPVAQASQALVGLVPGLTAIQSSGQPGMDNSTLRIRGTGSIGASNDPLVLIDGIAGNINDINASDIDDISILKDAAASAIYGSRASNGVILVTTKRAKSGQVSLNYSNYVGRQWIYEQPKYLGALDYLKYAGDYTQEYIDNYAIGMASNPDIYPDTDWISELYTEFGLQQNHNMSISGGSENIKTLASFSYVDKGANIVNYNYKRVNVRVNTDIKVNEKIDANFDLSFNKSLTKEPSAGLGPIIREVYRDPPIYTAVHSDGSWGEGWNGENGVALAHDGGNTMTESNYFRGVLRVNYSPIKDLKFSVMYAPEIGDSFRNRSIKRTKTIIDWETKTIMYNPNRNGFSQNFGRSYIHNFNALASYNKTFNSHIFVVLLGYEFIKNKYVTFAASRDDYILERYEVLNAGSAGTALNSGSATQSGLVSYFGRLNYSFKDKYLFEANIRRDASSRFAIGNRVSVFPSFSGGWRLSEEPFIHDLGLFSNLKLRASWGQLGNQQIGSDFPFASTIVLGSNNYLFNNAIVVGATQNVMANSGIKWETTETTNFGLDIGFFDQKLTFTAEYYIRKTKDILLRLPIPLVLGLTASMQNAGNVENKGWDFSLGWKDIKGNFTYYAQLNLSDVKNNVASLAGLSSMISGNSITIVGSPIGSIYGYESIGIFQTNEEIASSPTQFGTLIPGNLRYKDQLTVDSNTDGVPDATDGIINSQDRVIIGDPFPRMSYGLNLGAGYKGFDLSVYLQGVGKRDVLMRNYLVYPLYGKIQEWHVRECWSPENTDAKFPIIRHTSTGSNDAQTASTWVFDASYLRIRNISFGYTLPKTLFNNFVNSLRVYFSGQNLFTFDKLPEGIDPLMPNDSDGAIFPINSTITIGVDVQF